MLWFWKRPQCDFSLFPFQSCSGLFEFISSNVDSCGSLESCDNVWRFVTHSNWSSNGQESLDNFVVSQSRSFTQPFDFFQPKHDLFVLCLIGVYATYAFGLMFIGCELGQYVGDVFMEIDDVIEAFDWNLHQREMRRLLPTILSVTQQPVMIEFFGSSVLSREIFKKVSRNYAENSERTFNKYFDDSR